jgi:hypothetical protein
MYMLARYIDFVLFLRLLIRFWNCCDGIVFLVFLLDFGTVPKVWYFLFFD